MKILDTAPKGFESYRQYVSRCVKTLNDRRRLPLVHLDMSARGVYVLGIADDQVKVAGCADERNVTLISKPHPAAIITKIEPADAMWERFCEIPPANGNIHERTWAAILRGCELLVGVPNPQACFDWPFLPEVVDLAECLFE